MTMRKSLDSWDNYPEDMVAYLSNYGKHFNKKMYEFAVSSMYKINKSTNKKESIQPLTKDQVDNIMRKYNLNLENNVMYDAAYVMSMAMSDFLGSSLPNEQYLAMFVKDYVDDVDQVDGFIFNRFYADCIINGNPIDWTEML